MRRFAHVWIGMAGFLAFVAAANLWGDRGAYVALTILLPIFGAWMGWSAPADALKKAQVLAALGRPVRSRMEFAKVARTIPDLEVPRGERWRWALLGVALALCFCIVTMWIPHGAYRRW